jgi:antitoxin (DNA-binding transcriptional repressor) of toxin-antitoxin stability system
MTPERRRLVFRLLAEAAGLEPAAGWPRLAALAVQLGGRYDVTSDEVTAVARRPVVDVLQLTGPAPASLPPVPEARTIAMGGVGGIIAVVPEHRDLRLAVLEAGASGRVTTVDVTGEPCALIIPAARRLRPGPPPDVEGMIPVPIPAEAGEQLAAQIEATAGLDDPDLTEDPDGELTDEQQYARLYAGIVRSWPVTLAAATEPLTWDDREAITAAGRIPTLDLSITDSAALLEAFAAAYEQQDPTVITRDGEPYAMITAAYPQPEPDPSGATMLLFTLVTALPHDVALTRRDDVIAHLRALGIRLSATHDGTQVLLADVGAATIGDVFTGGPS